MPKSTPTKLRFSNPPVPADPLPTPTATETNSQTFSLDSPLTHLCLHDFSVESHHNGIDIARLFDRHPTLPGVIVLEKGKFLSMISRQRLLEFMIHGQGMGISLINPLSRLHSYTRTSYLILPETTSILNAAALALRRSPTLQPEPVIVQLADGEYRLLDIHELNVAHWQIRGIETQVRYERSQLQMIQTERMASLGRLVDGVAHEILDPVGFIWGNLVHLTEYTNQLMELINQYDASFPTVPEAIAELKTEMELDYLREDLPQAIASINAGAERLKILVTSLQNFCHLDDVYAKPADLHDCLDSILLLLKSRIGQEIQIVRHYGHLPPVSCFVGQLNQVFMNILVNAVDVLLNESIRQEVTEAFRHSHTQIQPRRDALPQITITTQIRTLPGDPENNLSPTRWVCIRITDNGSGLTDKQQQRILESFTTAKRAQKETSLTLSYQIVTVKHGGKFFFRSPPAPPVGEENPQPTHGSEFEVWLPLA